MEGVAKRGEQDKDDMDGDSEGKGDEENKEVEGWSWVSGLVGAR